MEQHLTAFVAAFVAPAKRERWHELLTRRGRNVLRHSHKLMDALDGRYCVRADGGWDLDPLRLGVFYDFHGEPETIPVAEAVVRGDGRDAIFSLDAGRLAIHFSHESWAWLCRR